ncbi:MAG: NUDIX hydrolase [Rhizobiaceae bacterium]|nr:NUDIX hydrolase [Rhizobiaceae bacterium]
MAFDLPRERVFQVSDVDVRLAGEPLAFEAANRDAIAANWQAELEANPALFNGRSVLLSSLALRDGRLVGRCHEIGYSTLLYWLKHRETSASEHCFAHAMLISSDGALVAARMAAHTVNAGKVYFAAGSFEPEDFQDGRADVDGNMIREVREETGLDLSALQPDPGYLAYSASIGTAIFRRYRLTERADEIAEQVRSFIAAEVEPEITEPVIIRDARNLPEGLMGHMRAIVDWHFGLA